MIGKEEKITCLALLQSNRINAQKYGKYKLTTLQRFIREHVVGILAEIDPETTGKNSVDIQLFNT